MLHLIRHNLLALVAFLLLANLAYDFLLFHMLERIRLSGEVRTFAIFFLPLLLSVAGTAMLKSRQYEKFDLHHTVALASSVVLPYFVLMMFAALEVLWCVHSGQKVCLL
jgi:hypothetical protein